MRLENLGLEPEYLWLVLFGPGLGESALVSVPGGHWIAIDSLRRLDARVDVNPTLEVLRRHDALLSLVALTHPHEDHVLGFTELLDRRLPETPVGCVDAYLPHDKRWRHNQDASKVRDRAAADAALNRINEIWRTEPASKWSMRAGSKKAVGDAVVEVLYPDTIPAQRPRDPNSLSTPMLLTWRSCRLLLGADLPNSGWRKVERFHKKHDDLTQAHALKASHHGSDTAQHHLAIGVPPPKGRVCLATPFNRGRKLPSYADNGGIDQLLKTHCRVTITNAPPQGRGKESSRVSLLPPQSGFGSLRLHHEDLSASPRQAWIAVGFDADGAEVLRHSGDAAGIVV